MLFASLDSTIRKLKINKRNFILVDTVGFIKSLPTSLIAAFKATLDEIINSDLILHIRDISNSENQSQKNDVLKVLKELGIERQDPRILDVINKIDLIDDSDETKGISKNIVSISALNGVGIESLKEKMYDLISH